MVAMVEGFFFFFFLVLGLILGCVLIVGEERERDYEKERVK